MKKGKFTFKTEHPTGSYRSFSNSAYYIKIKRKQVGQIYDKPSTAWARESQGDKVRIGFMVFKEDINEDGNKNCSWKWVQLKRTFESVEEAKEWLNSDGVFEVLNNKLKLRHVDD